MSDGTLLTPEQWERVKPLPKFEIYTDLPFLPECGAIISKGKDKKKRPNLVFSHIHTPTHVLTSHTKKVQLRGQCTVFK